MWSIRDAILKWLYVKALVDGIRRPVLRVDDIAITVEWEGEPLRQEEVAAASEWLRNQGYITFTDGDSGVCAFLTDKGAMLPYLGRSARGGNARADPQGTTNR